MGLNKGYGSRGKEVLPKPKLPFWKVHELRFAMNFSGDEFEVFLQIVCMRSHQNPVRNGTGEAEAVLQKMPEMRVKCASGVVHSSWSPTSSPGSTGSSRCIGSSGRGSSSSAWTVGSIEARKEDTELMKPSSGEQVTSVVDEDEEDARKDDIAAIAGMT